MSGHAPPQARRWVVAGRVQGVGFRWFVQRRADALDLRGWVRNLPDGRVEVIASGAASALEAMHEALHSGPRLAAVMAVETGDYPHDIDGVKTFEIR